MTPPKQNFNTIPAVYLILIQNEKTLLLERINTGYKDGHYSLVAGHKENNEKATDAMVREAKEEANIDIRPEDLDFVHVMHRRKENQEDERIDLFFTTNKWEGEIINAEPHKHGEPTWFPIDSLPENTVPFIREAIKNYRQGKYFSELFETMN